MFCSKCGTNVAEGAGFCASCGQPVGGVVAAPPVAGLQTGYVAARPTIAYAGFWLRFVAIIIDGILLAIVGGIITLPFMASIGFHGMFMHDRMPFNPADLIALFATFFWVILIRFVLNWLYFAAFESSAWRATLGKKALGLEVTDLAGQRISFGRASGRFFGKIISALILWIGFIMAGFTEKKQALHDMMAGCLVIRKL
jgi:uncharacterized RDD family membrane protein YckC